MSPSGNVLSQKLRHGGVARSPLADTELLGETFARGVEDRIRLLVKTVIGTTVGAVARRQARRRHRRHHRPRRSSASSTSRTPTPPA